MWCWTYSRPHKLFTRVTFLLQTFHDTQMSFFVVVLCHPAAPDESENVQSDESENGTLSKSVL